MSSPAWHRTDVEKILDELATSPTGLSSSEARKRFAVKGPNELARKKSAGLLTLFLQQFRNLLVIILIIATAFSFAIGEVLDGTVIAVIVVLNAVFGFVQEYHAGKAIEALKRMTAQQSLVMRDGKKVRVPSRELVPGDVVFLEDGTTVPADMRLAASTNLRVDEASLTGESQPVAKTAETLGKAILAERRNMCYMGTHVTYGRGTGIIVGTGMATEMGKIARMISDVPNEETPLQERLRVFSKSLGIIILLISVAVIAGGILRNYPPLDMVLTGIALAVAAIPEGLPAVVTITLALGLQKLSKKHALLRGLPAAETLGATSVICADKTGTLTRNEITVRKMWTHEQAVVVTGDGYSPDGNFLENGKQAALGAGMRLLLRIGALCNNASLDGETLLGDPTEEAILVAAQKGKISGRERRVDEVPFSSERKMMSTVNSVNGSRIVHTKGAPETVLAVCDRILWNGRAVKLDTAKRKAVLGMNRALTGEALRVLGFAYKELRKGAIEENLVFVGLMGMIDPPRRQVKNDVFVCRRAGIKVVMITGDHKNTAVAVAQEIGIMKSGDVVVTGEELDRMTDSRLKKLVEHVAVYARVNPSHKVRIVEALRKNGHIVAMTGDGVNDAPALKMADIGIAMGIKGTDVAKEASDMILADDNFSSIVSAVREGRGVYDNIVHFIRYLLSSNLAEVLIVFLAMLVFFSPGEVVVPLLAVQILWINLVTDGLPAIALGVDPPAKGVMSRMPRSPRENLLNHSALSFILIVGAIITAGTLWVFASELPDLAKAQTMAFTVLVLFEMFNVFNVRRLGFFTNKKLLIAVGVSVLLQFVVIYVPQLQEAFGTVPLGWADWVKVIIISSSVFIVMRLKSRLVGWE